MLGGHDEHYLRLLWLVASMIGALVVIGLAVVYRRAARRHELDEVERILDEEP